MSNYILKQPDGSIFPPMQMDELRTLAQNGGITKEHNIQIVGGNTWHPADKIQGLLISSRNQTASTPAVTGAQPNSDASHVFDTEKLRSGVSKAQAKIAGKAPIVKNLLLKLKTTIMSSPKNMAIAGGSAVAFLLILAIAFGGDSGVTQRHVKQLTAAGNNAVDAINENDIASYVLAMEDLAVAWESVADNAENIVLDLQSMDHSDGVTLALQVNALVKLIRGTYPALPKNLEPTDDEEMQLQNIQRRINTAQEGNVIYALLLS